MDHFFTMGILQFRTELEHISHINIMICGVILYHEKAIICHIRKQYLQLEMFNYFFLEWPSHSMSHIIFVCLTEGN